MESVDYLVIGAGVSGLAFANWIRAEASERGQPAPEVLVLEGEDEPGGYCRTVERDGFIWDYSGHFFHFRHQDIESWLRRRMPEADIRTVVKRSFIRHRGRDIDFPFQKNIHQLDKDEFIHCLVSLYFKDEGRDADRPPSSFKDMLHARLGAGICELFLVPYNEKLYACDLDQLDSDAMGRFFPHADIDDIVRNFVQADNRSYNATFTYPRGGAVEYVRALLHDLPAETVSCGERALSIDMAARTVRTAHRDIRYQHLISSAPLPALLAMTGLEHDRSAFRSNKVAVFNLGFDKKGKDDAHWIYFADKSLAFYRIGFYDNIHQADRMSLYVEVGAAADQALDMDGLRQLCLDDLAKEGIVDGHELVAHHQLVLDPAYVHITGRSLGETARVRAALAGASIHTVGRYGGWTYCSIEDNIVETRDLAGLLAERAYG